MTIECWFTIQYNNLGMYSSKGSVARRFQDSTPRLRIPPIKTGSQTYVMTISIQLRVQADEVPLPV